MLSHCKLQKHKTNNQAGLITPLILIMASIFIIFGVSLINWAMVGHKDTLRKVRKVQSLEIAEAGVNYYKWHLAHNSEDYEDGSGLCCGEIECFNTYGLVGYWNFEEGSGQTVYDRSGNNNNGTLGANSSIGSDDPSFYSPGYSNSGASGLALQYDGVNDYVKTGNIASGSFGTMEVWIRPGGDYTSDQHIMGAGNSSGSDKTARYAIGARYNTSEACLNEWFITLGNGTTSEHVCSGQIYNATNFPVGVWTHLAAAYDGTSVKFYKDGVLIKTAAQSVNGAGDAQPFSIGRNGELANYYFKGVIDQVRIYNRALSIDEIRRHYDQNRYGITCGPYVHQYKDNEGVVIGEFSLWLTSPEVGSTVGTIDSTGIAYGNYSTQKRIISRVGKRSLATYSFLTNTPLWLGENEGFAGPIHSNGGIRFDYNCTSNCAEVTSAVSSYNCAGTVHSCTGTKPGIWGVGGPTANWRPLSSPIITNPSDTSAFSIVVPPVPAIDFSLFTVDLQNIRTQAQSGGIYLPDSGGGKEGYLVRFNNDATVDIDKIDSLKSPQLRYWNYEKLPNGGWEWEAEEIDDLDNSPVHYNMPANGLIFIEDDVWVEGTVNGKVTLAAARFPENPNSYAKIRINNNVQYIARDGNHNLGIMAQGDLLVPKYAPTNLIIDATLLSQKRHVYYRYYYRDYRCYYFSQNCDANRIKNSIEVYGGIITNLFWTWTWVDGSNTVGGYNITNTVYNDNLTFNPPPSFPTSENYEFISWTEE